MSLVKRQVVIRLVHLACAEISQEVLKELRSKTKKKWGKEWVAGRGNFGASDKSFARISFRRSGLQHE